MLRQWTVMPNLLLRGQMTSIWHSSIYETLLLVAFPFHQHNGKWADVLAALYHSLKTSSNTLLQNLDSVLHDHCTEGSLKSRI